MDFSPALGNIQKVWSKNLHLLHSSPMHMRENFPEKSIFQTFHKCISLRCLFKSSKQNKSNDKHEGLVDCHKSEKSSYELCFIFQIPISISLVQLRVKDMLLGIICNLLCKLQYVGSTATPFNVRFRNPKSDLTKTQGRYELAIHFNSAIFVLVLLRKFVESLMLCTTYMFGLNKIKKFNLPTRVRHFS